MKKLGRMTKAAKVELNRLYGKWAGKSSLNLNEFYGKLGLPDEAGPRRFWGSFALPLAAMWLLEASAWVAGLVALHDVHPVAWGLTAGSLCFAGQVLLKAPVGDCRTCKKGFRFFWTLDRHEDGHIFDVLDEFLDGQPFPPVDAIGLACKPSRAASSSLFKAGKMPLPGRFVQIKVGGGWAAAEVISCFFSTFPFENSFHALGNDFFVNDCGVTWRPMPASAQEEENAK